MHVFQVAFFLAGCLYAFINEQALILYFLLILGAYMLISQFLPGGKSISNRKKIMLSTWSDPSEGIILLRVPVRTEKVQKIIDENTEEGKPHPTMTHFVIKACGEILKHAPDLNGYYSFGKFVPHKSKDISCLVDIGGGKDLAMILVKDADKKSVEEIAKFIKDKATNIKQNKGDVDHKRRTQLADYFPAFLVSALMSFVTFITSKLCLNVKALSLEKGQFGAACLTSVGMLGFEDAFAPHSGYTKCSFFVAVNAVTEAPVIENGEVKVGKVMNLNFSVDHRFVDGGRAKQFMKVFKQTFDEPQKYFRNSEPSQQNQEKPLKSE